VPLPQPASAAAAPSSLQPPALPQLPCLMRELPQPLSLLPALLLLLRPPKPPWRLLNVLSVRLLLLLQASTAGVLGCRTKHVRWDSGQHSRS
jgi:hypothetical protein